LASDALVGVVQVPVLLWRRVTRELRRRGRGRQESGAFLLGRQRGERARARAYICYDDLDPHAYQGGGITFHAEGYAAFWQYCREKKLQLLADVHTHPGSWIEQSPTDQRNPMVPVVGHTALIVPKFGQTPWWSLDGVGVYEYLGDFKWRTHPSSDAGRRVVLTLW
jgi:proteasome lid subunit RPN8/RPN11